MSSLVPSPYFPFQLYLGEGGMEPDDCGWSNHRLPLSHFSDDFDVQSTIPVVYL